MNPSVLLAPLFAAAVVAQPAPTGTPIPLPTPPPAAATAAPASGSTTPPPAMVSPAPAVSGAACPPGPTISAPANPIATPNYTYHFVPRQPAKLTPCEPQIFEVDLNSETLESQGDIDIRVQTNDYVVKVVSKSGGREGSIPLVEPREFIAFSKLPKLPFIARGMSLNLQFIGYGVDGRTVTVSVPVKLR